MQELIALLSFALGYGPTVPGGRLAKQASGVGVHMDTDSLGPVSTTQQTLLFLTHGLSSLSSQPVISNAQGNDNIKNNLIITTSHLKSAYP